MNGQPTNDSVEKQHFQWLFAGLSGGLFGVGLSLSEMINPARVIGFLDIAGDWDPTLGFVMLGALAISTPAFQFRKRLVKPWLAATFTIPTKKDLDARLLIGAAVFGVGWGLAGLCPGPAVVAITTGITDTFVFLVSMIVGSYVVKVVDDRLL